MRITLFVLVLFLLLSGCNQQSTKQSGNQQSGKQSTQQSGKQTNQQPQQSKAQTAGTDAKCEQTPVRNFQAEKHVQALAKQVAGIDRAVAVQIDNELDVGIEMSNLNRFKFKSIHKEVAEKLKAAYPNTKIHVTSDKKLISELEKLNRTPWSTKHDEACKQKKQIKKIEKDMKG